MQKIIFTTALILSFLSGHSKTFAQNEDQKAKALALYEKGNANYNLGRWPKAIALFEEAFETYPAPAFLFNIGQAHRQSGNCRDAVFFYKRYLSLKPDAPNRQEAEGFIADQKAICEQRDEASKKLPTGTVTPDGEEGSTTSAPLPSQAPPLSSPPNSSTVKESAGTNTLPSRKRIRIHGGFGLTSVNLGGENEIDLNSNVEIYGGVGYLIPLGGIELDIGPWVSFSPLSFDDFDGSDRSAAFTRLLANIGANYSLTERIAIRGQLGVGINIFSGIGVDDAGDGLAESIFVENGAPNGAISTLSGRIALGVEYQFSQSFALEAALATSLIAVPPGFSENINNIRQTSWIFGLAYKI